MIITNYMEWNGMEWNGMEWNGWTILIDQPYFLIISRVHLCHSDSLSNTLQP